VGRYRGAGIREAAIDLLTDQRSTHVAGCIFSGGSDFGVNSAAFATARPVAFPAVLWSTSLRKHHSAYFLSTPRFFRTL